MIVGPAGKEMRRRIGFIGGFVQAPEERMEVSAVGGYRIDPEEPEAAEAEQITDASR